MKKSRFLVVGLTLVALFIGMFAGGVLAKSDFPSRPIEFVVPFAPGGGSDNMARMIASINDKEKILPQPLVVVNKPGGSGSIGMSYVQTKTGDPYVIMTGVPQVLTVPLTTGSTDVLHWTKLTPIALLALDEFMLIVRYDSPYQTVKDLIDAAKAAPGVVKFGGSEVGSEDSIVTDILAQKAGVKFNYIPFKSGGEVMTALLGGHLDVAWANPNEAMAQMEAKKVRVLAVANNNRLKGAPNIPTLKESGIPVHWQMLRGIFAAPGIKDAERKTLEQAFKKLTETQTWKKDYVEANLLTPQFMDSKAYTKFLKDKEAEYKAILKNLGVIK